MGVRLSLIASLLLIHGENPHAFKKTNVCYEHCFLASVP